MVGPGYSVRYLDNGGRAAVFRGGSRSWCKRDPGSLVCHGLLALQHGAAGFLGGEAVFPRRRTRHDCLVAVPASRQLAHREVTQACKRFDPTCEPRQPEPPERGGPNDAPPPSGCPHAGFLADPRVWMPASRRTCSRTTL